VGTPDQDNNFSEFIIIHSYSEHLSASWHTTYEWCFLRWFQHISWIACCLSHFSYAQNWKIQHLIWRKYLIKAINILTTDQLSPTVGKLSINPPPEWQLQRHFPETMKPSDVMAKFKGWYVVCAEHGVRREIFTGIQTVKEHSPCIYSCFKIFHDKQDF